MKKIIIILTLLIVGLFSKEQLFAQAKKRNYVSFGGGISVPILGYGNTEGSTAIYNYKHARAKLGGNGSIGFGFPFKNPHWEFNMIFNLNLNSYDAQSYVDYYNSIYPGRSGYLSINAYMQTSALFGFTYNFNPDSKFNILLRPMIGVGSATPPKGSLSLNEGSNYAFLNFEESKPGIFIPTQIGLGGRYNISESVFWYINTDFQFGLAYYPNIVATGIDSNFKTYSYSGTFDQFISNLSFTTGIAIRFGKK